MKKVIYYIWTLLLIVPLLVVFPIESRGANQQVTSERDTAEKKRSSSSKKNYSTKKKTVKKSHKRIKATQTGKKSRKKVNTAQRKYNTAANKSRSQKATRTKTSRPIYAPSLAELKGPLPEVLEGEISRLRQTRRLLNSDDISIHIHDLTRDASVVNIKADRVRNAASLIKPFVMLAVYDLAYQNKLSLTSRIETQIYKMITVSHNESTNSLIRLIGGGNIKRGLHQINSTLTKYGFRDTYLVEAIPEGGKTYRNRTSAYDMSAFFRRIYQRSLISPYYSKKMIDVLLDNKVRRIETPVLVQDGVPVADKTGYVRGTNGDCGIVFLRNVNRAASDYVVSIIIENPHKPFGSWGRQKTVVIRQLSNLIYAYFRQQTQTAAVRSALDKG